MSNILSFVRTKGGGGGGERGGAGGDDIDSFNATGTYTCTSIAIIKTYAHKELELCTQFSPAREGLANPG